MSVCTGKKHQSICISLQKMHHAQSGKNTPLWYLQQVRKYYFHIASLIAKLPQSFFGQIVLTKKKMCFFLFWKMFKLEQFQYYIFTSDMLLIVHL